MSVPSEQRTATADPATRDEIAFGRELDSEVVDLIGVYTSAGLDHYIDSVGRRLAARSARPALPWTFRVLDQREVNAFAAPGGFIYVTRGMLAWLGSEAELAAVLAHEIGHVVARHMLVSQAFVDARSGFFTHADRLHFYELSRDNEREADELAVELVGRAGYDPRAVAAMLTDLKAAEGWRAQSEDNDRAASGAREDPAYDDHPATVARIARALRLANGRARGLWKRRPYLRRLNGLVFGDDPRKGHLVGRRYVCLEDRFSFQLPRGWAGTSKDGWLIASRGHDLALLLLPMAHSTLSGARSILDRPVQGKLRRERIAGFSSLTGSVSSDGTASQVVILKAKRRTYLLSVVGGRAARLAMRRIVRSLRRLPDAAARATARRISVERVVRPTTLRRFAHEHGTAIGLSELALLNGLGTGAELRPGALLKNVVMQANARQ